jgi:hypothetical protein
MRLNHFFHWMGALDFCNKFMRLKQRTRCDAPAVPPKSAPGGPWVCGGMLGGLVLCAFGWMRPVAGAAHVWGAGFAALCDVAAPAVGPRTCTSPRFGLPSASICLFHSAYLTATVTGAMNDAGPSLSLLISMLLVLKVLQGQQEQQPQPGQPGQQQQQQLGRPRWRRAA